VEVADRKEIQDRLSHFHLHQGESVSADRRRGLPTGRRSELSTFCVGPPMSCREFLFIYEGDSIMVVIQAIGKSKGRKDIRQGVYER
jgi:hypothetical protein